MTWLLPYFLTIVCLNSQGAVEPPIVVGPYDSLEDAQYYREAFRYDYRCDFYEPQRKLRLITAIPRVGLVDSIRDKWVEHFDQHVREWMDDMLTLGVWSGHANRYYKPQPPIHICWEAEDVYIRSLTLEEYRRQRRDPTSVVFNFLTECYCNEVAAVNCLETWTNHAAYQWPEPWIK
jgi:hypothetical protein